MAAASLGDCLFLVAMHPGLIGISVSEDASASEEAIGVLSFLPKAAFRIAPLVFGVVVVIGTCMLAHTTIALFARGLHEVVPELVWEPTEPRALAVLTELPGVRLVVAGANGTTVPVSTLYEGDFIGQTALTREPVTGSAYAVGEVTVARIERDALERLLSGKPELLQDLSQAIDERRVRAHAALTGEGNQSAVADA